MDDENKTREELIQELNEARRQLAEQARLSRAERVAALERLAGGVAHDINNALTGILGYVSVLLRRQTPDDPEYEDLDAIRRSATRIRTLTHQLQAFSRRLAPQRVETDLNVLMSSLKPQLQEMVGEEIQLEFDLSLDLATTQVDPEQMRWAVAALVQNAREATPPGGRITLETANVELLDECACQCGQMFCGSYVMLEVRDTGAGMDEATLAHAFEPFFTTKGKRPGLGLPVASGLVALNGGHIVAESAPGRGTIIRIYLPRTGHPASEASAAQATAAPDMETHATVLVVEDETDVRELVYHQLALAGYTALQAPDGESALEVLRQRPIALLLADFGLSGALNGRELAEQARAYQPGLKVLMITGSASCELTGLPETYALLEKPFTSDSLLAAVQKLLRTAR